MDRIGYNSGSGSPGQCTMQPKHTPYQVDPEHNRAHHYEDLWKLVALQLLLRHCSAAGLSALDYGCGRGETLKIFGQAGFNITGTDTDPECVRLASRFGPARLLEPERVLDQFGRKSFDVVTCFHVLEHVENPRQTLGNLAAMARQFVLLAVPNLRNLLRLSARRIDKNLINEGHLQAWDHWHLLNLAERYCGLHWVEWGFDATQLSGLSNLSEKILGQRLTIRLETGLFKRLFPYHGISIIGLFKAPLGS